MVIEIVDFPIKNGGSFPWIKAIKIFRDRRRWSKCAPSVRVLRLAGNSKPPKWRPRWWRSNWWKDVPPQKKIKDGKAEKRVILSWQEFHFYPFGVAISWYGYRLFHTHLTSDMRSPKRASPWVLWRRQLSRFAGGSRISCVMKNQASLSSLSYNYIRASTRGPPGPPLLFLDKSYVTHNKIHFGTKSPTDHPSFGTSPG
jgi:hypothetical protein